MDGLPERFWRWPNAVARVRLSQRFGLPLETNMQDWEWEVADPTRIGEFLAAYESGELSDDERFTLMEMIIQSFEDTGSPTSHQLWPELLATLDRNINLHLKTVWYWASTQGGKDELWQVSGALRSLLELHRGAFGLPPFEE